MSHPVLIAAVDFARAVRQHNTQSGSGGHGWFLLAVVAAIGLFWAGLYYWDRIRKQRKRLAGSADSLFAELCDTHRLDRSERAILTQAARASHLEEPVLLFVDPTLFERTLKTVATDPGQRQDLAQRLFGEAAAKKSANVTTA